MRAYKPVNTTKKNIICEITATVKNFLTPESDFISIDLVIMWG